LRILFTHSYFLRFDPKQWKNSQPYPPLGTIQAASLLREKGFEVFLHDVMFEKNAQSITAALDKWKPGLMVIYDDGFNYLTKMCLTNMREAAFEMAGIANHKGCTVVVASSDAADHYEKYLDHGAHYVITGEGEQTLLELSSALENNYPIETLQGIIYRSGNETILNSKRPVMQDLDSLPLPAWDLIDIKLYRESWIRSSGYFSINMNTTRGCPFHCNWCAKPIYGNRYNSRSVEHVISEIKLLKKLFNMEHIWFCDDIFGLKPGWVKEFAERVIHEGLDLSFKIQSRVDLLLQENYITALARSGCKDVWVGAESGSQKILDAMDKGTKVEQIYEATRLLKKHHIRPSFFLQFGYPGETKDDIDKTIRMVMDLLPFDIGVSISYPLPGTKFYEKVKAELGAKANWNDSDELMLMFSNTYPPGFYKALHRYIHKSYRAAQGFDELKSIVGNPSNISRHSLKRIASLPFHFSSKFLHRSKMNHFEKRLPAAGKLLT
jgi:anaerobic magnesium-protoporphyrin IX monomethyl ester cyclase